MNLFFSPSRLNDVKPLQHLDAALDLSGLGRLVPEPLDEFLRLFNLRALEGHLFFQGLQTPFLFGQIEGIVALIDGQAVIG